jgi:hypothetical protein
MTMAQDGGKVVHLVTKVKIIVPLNPLPMYRPPWREEVKILSLLLCEP